jgi:branched-chain amino acid aminotransferase
MIAEDLGIDIQPVAQSRIGTVDFNNLVFGKNIADHMFVVDYTGGQWQNARIIPYGDLSLSPALAALHYGQSIFEGMKAYKNTDGEVLMFRPTDNHKRINRSAVRMCMPEIPEDIFMEGLTELLRLDAEWVPATSGHSLYIRPYMFATDEYIGVRPSETYKFIIFSSPTGHYYTKAPRVKVETSFIRAADGGVGFTKCAGNYGGSLYPAKLAQQQGYDQLLWTDAQTHEYFEESGTMNVMFVIDGKLIAPAVSDTILNGITRNSIVQIAKHWNMEVEERKVSVKEVIEGIKLGRVESAFGAGTAVVISPFAAIGFEGVDYELPEATENTFAIRAKNYLTNIRMGKIADPFGWMMTV